MNQSNILDQAVPDIGVSTLKLSPFRNFPPTLKKIALNAAGKVRKRINDFADWLMAYAGMWKRLFSNRFHFRFHLHRFRFRFHRFRFHHFYQNFA